MQTYNGYSIYNTQGYDGQNVFPNFTLFTDNPLLCEDLSSMSIGGEYKFNTLAEAKKFVDNLLSI